MVGVSLHEVAILLAALAIAAPLARWLGIGAVLGYLVAGVLLGPYGARLVVLASTRRTEILHFAEFGVVLLLFLIGLELRPKRLWAMRTAIFGLGGAQVPLTGAGAGGRRACCSACLAGRAVRRPGAVAVVDRLRAAGAGGEGRAAAAARPARRSPCCCSRIWPPSR